MYTLYGKAGSGSAAIEAALVVARAPFHIVETASWAQNEAYADLLAVNPLGQVPTLVLEDGSAMSESAAILIHLGALHRDSRLLPENMSGRAQADRGL
jgi:GST-like protein